MVLNETNVFREFHIFRGLFRLFRAAFPSTNKNSSDNSALANSFVFLFVRGPRLYSVIASFWNNAAEAAK
jgi:hypothetical protein